MENDTKTMAPEVKARLHADLVRLGDMMGDGLHHEPDGRWITAAYRRVMRALGHTLPRRNNSDSINRSMSEFLAKTPCPKCGGTLKQNRSGSKRAGCAGCGALFQAGHSTKKKE